MSQGPVLELELEGVWRSGNPIIGELSIAAAPGETLALVGPSGIGKTTLLRVAAGLQHGARGTVSVSERRAMMFQEPRLLPWRTLAQNLTIATGIDATRATNLLSEAGLRDKADHLPSQISLGQQRRVALMRALATDPEVLLMDEPFVSLDAETAASMMSLFSTMRSRRKMAVVFVTHAMEEARALATRIVTLGGAPARIESDAENTAPTMTVKPSA